MTMWGSSSMTRMVFLDHMGGEPKGTQTATGAEAEAAAPAEGCDRSS
jgi:hypothetical protein